MALEKNIKHTTGFDTLYHKITYVQFHYNTLLYPPYQDLNSSYSIYFKVESYKDQNTRLANSSSLEVRDYNIVTSSVDYSRNDMYNWLKNQNDFTGSIDV